MNEMIVEIIIAILALIGSFGGVLVSNNKLQALIVYRLDELEKKQDKHNSVIERTYNIERRLDVIDEKLIDMTFRITNLEKR